MKHKVLAAAYALGFAPLNIGFGGGHLTSGCRKLKLPKDRISKLIERHKTPSFGGEDIENLGLWAALENVLLYLNTNETLDLFESASNLPLLLERIHLSVSLQEPSASRPLHSRLELASILKKFLSHQRLNRTPLIKTGYPATGFLASPWIDAYLGRLCPTKLPATWSASISAETLKYEYRWRDASIELPIEHPFSPEQIYPRDQVFDGKTMVEYGRRGKVVSYENAKDFAIECPSMSALLPVSPYRVEKIRLDLVTLRECVFAAAIKGLKCPKEYKPDSLVELLATEIQKCETAEWHLHYFRFWEKLNEHIDCWPSQTGTIKHFIPDDGHIFSLLYVIWFIEKEILIGTMHTLRCELRQPFSYNDHFGRPLVLPFFVSKQTASKGIAALDTLMRNLELEDSKVDFGQFLIRAETAFGRCGKAFSEAISVFRKHCTRSGCTNPKRQMEDLIDASDQIKKALNRPDPLFEDYNCNDPIVSIKGHLTTYKLSPTEFKAFEIIWSRFDDYIQSPDKVNPNLSNEEIIALLRASGLPIRAKRLIDIFDSKHRPLMKILFIASRKHFRLRAEDPIKKL
ncbi:hypothetical protein WDW86_05650 [Bdellovibrionota bacterium FG-2]